MSMNDGMALCAVDYAMHDGRAIKTARRHAKNAQFRTEIFIWLILNLANNKIKTTVSYKYVCTDGFCVCFTWPHCVCVCMPTIFAWMYMFIHQFTGVSVLHCNRCSWCDSCSRNARVSRSGADYLCRRPWCVHEHHPHRHHRDAWYTANEAEAFACHVRALTCITCIYFGMHIT